MSSNMLMMAVVFAARQLIDAQKPLYYAKSSLNSQREC